MENIEKFLATFYWKTKNNPGRGADPQVIRRMLHISPEDLPEMLYSLSEQKLVKTDTGYGDNIALTAEGMGKAREMIRKQKISFLIYTSAQLIPPVERMVLGFRYFYNLISPEGDERNGSVVVLLSDVATIEIGLSFGRDFAKDGAAEKLLLQYGRDWIAEKLQEGSVGVHEERLIMSKDLEGLPKYRAADLVSVCEAVFPIAPPIQPIAEIVMSNQLAPLLIETRDAINALFYDVHKQRLLLLPQERNLLDFFKDAANADEFSVRIMSLGAIAREMNVEILRKLTGISNTDEKSVALLKAYLLSKVKAPEKVSEPLRHLGKIRNGYPAHTDHADVVKSYRYLGIEYPVVDFSTTWRALLNHYLAALQELKSILIQK